MPANINVKSLSDIDEIPDFVRPLIFAFGYATVNWGKMEQFLEMLVHAVNREEYDIGYVQNFPTTSFRLKSELFERWYAKHPAFEAVHDVAGPVCLGLKKANKSRLNITHSTVQDFSAGPPAVVNVLVTRIKGADFHVATASWTEQQILDLGRLLSHLIEDFAKIAEITMTEHFRQSLRKRRRAH